MAEKVVLAEITIKENVTPVLDAITDRMREQAEKSSSCLKKIQDSVENTSNVIESLPPLTIKDLISNQVDKITTHLDSLIDKMDAIHEQAGYPIDLRGNINRFSQLATEAGYWLQKLKNKVITEGATIRQNLYNSLRVSLPSSTLGAFTKLSNINSQASASFGILKNSAIRHLSPVTSAINTVVMSLLNINKTTSPIDALFRKFDPITSKIKMLGPAFTMMKNIAIVALQNIMKHLQNLNDALTSMRQIIVKVYDDLSTLYSFGDEQRGYEYRISVFADGITNSKELRSQLQEASLEAYTNVDTLSNLTSGIMISGATDGNAQKAVDLAKNISKAMVATGASASEMNSSTLQLKQALSSGVLQGDELRSIREQTPGVMIALAAGIREMAKAGELSDKYMNTSMGDLKELGSDGVLTSEVVVRAMELGAQETSELFNNMPITFERAMTQLASIGQGLWARITDSGTAFGMMILGLSDAINNLTKMFTEGSAQVDAFFEGFNNGMAPLIVTLEILGTLFSGIIDFVTQGEEALGAFQMAGIIAGIALTAIVVLLTVKFATLGVTMLTALWPIIFIVAKIVGIITLIGIGITAVKGESITLQNVITNLFLTLVQVARVVGNILLGAVIAVATGVFTIATGVVTVIEFTKALITTISNGLQAGVYTVGAIFLDLISSIATGIGNMASSLGQVLNTIANKIADIIDGINEVAGYIGIEFDYGELRNAGNDWGDDILEKADELKNISSDFWGKVNELSQDTGDAWADAVENIATFQENGYDKLGVLTDAQSEFDSFMADLEGNVDDMVGKFFNNETLAGGTDTEGMYNDLFSDIKTSTEEIADSSGQTAKNTSDKSVELSDDDIEYLRSIAARDFMVVVNTKAPKITTTFGDVRETADVDSILNTITDMVENQLAVSLVS